MTNFRSLLRPILLGGLVAGTLDICAAMLMYCVIFAQITPERLLQSVASGVWGKEAFAGGLPIAFSGLAFHYGIATVWAAIFTLLHAQLPLARKGVLWLVGSLYGITIWLGMNFVVVPLSNAAGPRFAWASTSAGIFVHIVCIGLPIVFIARKYSTSE